LLTENDCDFFGHKHFYGLSKFERLMSTRPRY